MKRGKLSEEVVNSDSDYESSNSQELSQLPVKISKSEKKEEKSNSISVNDEDDGKYSFEISAKRKITVQKYRTNILVDIREFYEDKISGKERPGSKGISLSSEQYEKFKELIPEIDAALKKIK